MINYLSRLFLFICLLSLVGCHQSTTEILTQDQLIQLTDDDIVSINRTYCQKQDHYEVLAPQSHPLQKRLNQLVKLFPSVVNNKPLNYTIYLNTTPAAWSSLNAYQKITSDTHPIISKRMNKL